MVTVNHEAAKVDVSTILLLLDEEKSHGPGIEIGSPAPSGGV